MPNLSVDVYGPGHDVTAFTTADIQQSHFAQIDGDLTGEGVLTVAPADPGGRIAGVAKYDGDAGTLIGLARGNSRIVRVVAGASVTAGDDVEVGPDGTAVPHTDGVVVGYSVNTATTGEHAFVSLA
ncbi:DUF2190 domain-containing protein [Gordonia sp. CPCC 206044]|uniref:DUF2190 domain-containing protein n=1 Tax=Gordonia sp. CPCC 206044 TaxID=3140793 RepID=UPI003AF3D85C